MIRRRGAPRYGRDGEARTTCRLVRGRRWRGRSAMRGARWRRTRGLGDRRGRRSYRSGAGATVHRVASAPSSRAAVVEETRAARRRRSSVASSDHDGDRRRLRERVHRPGGALGLDARRNLGGRDGAADAEPGERVVFRERAHPYDAVGDAASAVGVAGAQREKREDRRRRASRDAARRGRPGSTARDADAGGVGGRADVDEARPLAPKERVERSEVDREVVLRARAVLEDDGAGARGGRAHLGERGLDEEHAIARTQVRARERPQEIDRAVADDDPRERDAEPLGERAARRARGGVGVAVDSRRRRSRGAPTAHGP